MLTPYLAFDLIYLCTWKRLQKWLTIHCFIVKLHSFWSTKINLEQIYTNMTILITVDSSNIKGIIIHTSKMFFDIQTFRLFHYKDVLLLDLWLILFVYIL